jgi:hypothetical protein
MLFKQKNRGLTMLDYLKTLSKDELINLVIKFAPEDFRQDIDISKEETDSYLNEIVSNISTLLEDDGLLYDPISFQNIVSSYMKKLKSFNKNSVDRVFEIIFDLVYSIENRSDEGYLYIDHYNNNEEYFDFDILELEIIEIIKKIESKDKQIEIFMKFSEVSYSSCYISFDFNTLKVDDKQIFLKYFNQDSNLNFYIYIEELLSFDIKEKYLLAQPTNLVYSLIVDLYIENGKESLAIDYLEALLQEKYNLDYLKILLSIKDIPKEKLRVFILQAIECSVYQNLNFIFENINRVDNSDEIEGLLKDKSLDYYYQFLEKEKRIPEIFKLLNKLSDKQENFYQKYKSLYPEEARVFFKAGIKENLKSTGNQYYDIIANYLTHLREIIDENEFIVMVDNLKSEYKRRPNFIAILNRKL